MLYTVAGQGAGSRRRSHDPDDIRLSDRGVPRRRRKGSLFLTARDAGSGTDRAGATHRPNPALSAVRRAAPKLYGRLPQVRYSDRKSVV